MKRKGPRLFGCERLAAYLSPRQCLFFQVKASTLREQGRSLGLLRSCLRCGKGQRVQAYLPERTITVMIGCMKHTFKKW